MYSYWLSIASLILSASASAVPLGASNFWLWCFSTISTSNPAAASTFEASCSNFKSVLIPRDIFAERSTAVSFAASLVFASCSSESPVVHSTNGSFFFAQYSNTLSVAFADEKSIIASASTSHVSISVNTGYPLSLLSTISIPATISASASFSTRPLITCPMWPLQPLIIILTIFRSSFSCILMLLQQILSNPLIVLP